MIGNGQVNIPWGPYTCEVGVLSGTPPTMADSHTKEAAYGISGDGMSLAFSYHHGVATGATNGNGTYCYSLPDGWEIDDTKIITVENAPGSDPRWATKLGQADVWENLNGSANACVVALDKTCIGVFIPSYISAAGATMNVNNLHKSDFFAWATTEQNVFFTCLVIPVVKV